VVARHAAGDRTRRRAESISVFNDSELAGLAVDMTNDRAQRLYERLGYGVWAHGLVIDRWTQRGDDGLVLGEQADECFYLIKQLT
jgi:hypothetical protein